METLSSGVLNPIDGLVRVLIFIDHQSRGNVLTPLTAGDVLQNLPEGEWVNESYNFLNVPNRFQILLDEVVRIPQGVAAVIGSTPGSAQVGNSRGKVHHFRSFEGDLTSIWKDSGGAPSKDIVLMLITDQVGNRFAYNSVMFWEDISY
ncbi:MAG: hypothetical protein [Cressdnaviricota sp.]|nr:MAG: hypothetical protein [Cressdnaviricota sp.]